MPDDPLDLLRKELGMARQERDAAVRELASLRAWLTVKLGIAHRKPSGPHGLTVLEPATDAEIVAAVEQLRAEVSFPTT
ncbi:hypothetical protein ACH47C_23855 [Streptomyces rishiriensis]|uniref:hypothetical protein n=1 Tax=Streptomyces rishiriensis TaxID=68264 RepID=UPI0033C89B5C